MSSPDPTSGLRHDVDNLNEVLRARRVRGGDPLGARDQRVCRQDDVCGVPGGWLAFLLRVVLSRGNSICQWINWRTVRRRAR